MTTTIQEKMVDFYMKDPDVKKFILDFFKLKNKEKEGKRGGGVRSRTIHNMRDGWAPYIYGMPKEMGICFTDINKTNFWFQMGMPGTMHFREWIYDDIVKICDPGKTEGYEFEEYRIGISLVLDIDAPTVIVSETGYAGYGTSGAGGVSVTEKKVDFFDEIYFDDFNRAKILVEKEVEELGLDFNCMFSGNGVYLILESIYPKKIEELRTMGKIDEINNYWDVMYASCIKINIFDINIILEEEGILCRLDERWKAWSLYHKSPWTYHGKLDRLSIPIERGKMDRDWMNLNTDLNRLDEIDTKEIIRKAKWKEIW